MSDSDVSSAMSGIVQPNPYKAPQSDSQTTASRQKSGGLGNPVYNTKINPIAIPKAKKQGDDSSGEPDMSPLPGVKYSN